jgi:hypothetical protein
MIPRWFQAFIFILFLLIYVFFFCIECDIL